MSATKPYRVLRAIFMDGQRVEPGQPVQLTAQQAVELAAAGRVERAPVQGAEPAKADAKPAARARRSGSAA